jgi:hypothetical protein
MRKYRLQLNKIHKYFRHYIYKKQFSKYAQGIYGHCNFFSQLLANKLDKTKLNSCALHQARNDYTIDFFSLFWFDK